MSTKKTIQINPELFKIPGNKTRKNKEKKELKINPIVSPSNLKNKLLKRIKEHKTKDIKNTTPSKDVKNTIDENYNDEFYGAIDYLSGLSKKKKQQTMINNKTLKNTSSLNTSITQNNMSNNMSNIMSNIMLDLPPELEDPIKPLSNPSEIFNVNYKSINDVPYGCLKNGNKKTYREWKSMNESTEMIRPPTPPKKTMGVFLEGAVIEEQEAISVNTLSREDRLEQIKNKLKKMEDKETYTRNNTIETLKNMEKDMKTNNNINLDELTEISESEKEIEEILKEREDKEVLETPKQYVKKTIKRKFTLGKSDKLRRIAVLIHNKQTRKNVINTQKELKKTNITDVRKYLRQHGLIKVGSLCPADILRKTFESALMTGEVTNTNKEMLLHNFLHENTDVSK